MTDADRPARRVQQQRRRGWRLPPGAVSVAGTSKWANPHRPRAGQRTHDVNRAAVARYEADLVAGRLRATLADLHELTGRDLACFCPPSYPCHADVLLRLANNAGGVTA